MPNRDGHGLQKGVTMLKCPKAISIREPFYPYGPETRFCPFSHFPCVLEFDAAETCLVAKTLVKFREITQLVFDDTCQVSGIPDCLLDNVEVVADYDMTAEKMVEFLFERMTAEELYAFLRE